MPHHPTNSHNESPNHLPPSAEAKPVTILLIEDNQLVMNLIKDILEQEGWLVECAEDGFSAHHKLEGEKQYELIITDNDLPGLCGVELIKHARKMSHRQRIPIIMVSAQPYHSEAAQAGADAFLRKPEDVFLIPETVARLLGIRIVNGAN